MIKKEGSTTISPSSIIGSFIEIIKSELSGGAISISFEDEAIEAIKYIPQNHYLREEVIAKHHKHLRALIPLQSSNGGWRQVIDVENSYEELTATCMIGYSLANNIKLGLLTKENIDILYKAWNFVDQKIENTGIVHDSCTGTGSMTTLNDYLIRKRENGFDNRGGSLAAWFLVSLYEILI